eukprot:1722996-Lingulodinium_polyedra.AAC.1
MQHVETDSEKRDDVPLQDLYGKAVLPGAQGAKQEQEGSQTQASSAAASKDGNWKAGDVGMLSATKSKDLYHGKKVEIIKVLTATLSVKLLDGPKKGE